MSDWQVGDLAVCVNRARIDCRDGYFHDGSVAPQLGACNRVAVVAPAHSHTGKPMRCGCVALHFSDGTAGVTQRFRKLDKHEACEEEFVTLLKRAKRPVSA